MMDPLQLQMMQEASRIGMPGMLPGLYAPATTGGADMLMQMAQTAYAPPIAGNTLPDVSPLAPLNLQQYGLIGTLAGIAGNTVLTNTMQQQGILPIGNAGSYMQAYRTREHLNMRQQVAQAVSSQDTEGIYRTLRGAAAMAGMPFNREQQAAARNLAQTASQYMPTLAMVAPEFADAIAGERGSVQAMASQMLEANRYRVDPITGRMGYGVAANRDMVEQVFETMFADDNMARMQGLRAGDVGQMYRQLAPEGLAGPRGGLRARTIETLQRARDEGVDLVSIANEQGVNLGADQNLESLSNQELTKLRENKGIQSRLTQADSRQITDQLQGYVSSISAMREVFGENGNPNAPVPQLINALKALTSGQMQKFDANQLNTMVRDMQAMSQMSGKSIDQLLMMNQAANAANTQILGQYGVHFNPAATNIGVTTGMAFAESGGATGFGALSREQAEQASMNMFSRGMGSQMANALGALTRIEEAGGFADNAAGREMKAALAAADAGAETYTFVDDAGNAVTRQTPTREGEFRSIVSRGAISGMDAGDFNQMLGDRTSNLRALSTNQERQMAAMRQQPQEINRLAAQTTANRLMSNSEIERQFTNRDDQIRVAGALGRAATNAADELTMEQLQDPKQRNQAIAEALMVEAASQGMTLTEEQALNMAATSFGQRETVLRHFTGMDATGYAQTNSKAVRESRAEKQAMVSAQAGLNEAMSGMGPKGGIIQRLFTSLQKQGDRGTTADINTLLGDMFAVDMDQASEKLTPVMREVKEQKDKVESLKAELEGADPAKRAELQLQIKEETQKLTAKVAQTRDIATGLGLIDKENVYNKADVAEGNRAANELEQLNRMSQVRAMSVTGTVSAEERLAATKTKVTDADLRTLAVADRQKALAEADKASEREVISDEALRARVEKQVRDDPQNAQGLMTGPSDEELEAKIEEEFEKQRKNVMSPEAKEVYDRAIREGSTPQAARARVREKLRAGVGTVEQLAANKRNALGDNVTIADLADGESVDMIIRSRRANIDMIPTDQQLKDRVDEFRSRGEGQAKKTQEEIDKLNETEKRDYLKTERQLRNQAEDQLLAENQLRALGQLGEKETLLTDPAKMASLPVELRDKLAAVKPEERANLVFEYLDRKQQEQFYGVDDADIEKKREIARAYLQQSEGIEQMKVTEQNLAVLTDKRREYLSDDQAIARGGARGMLAVTQSQQAEEDLQTLANRYYGSSVGSALVTGGLAMTDEGIAKAKEEFGKLTTEQKDKIAARLKAEGLDVGDSANLTEANYRHYISLQAKDAKDTMTSAHKTMGGAADQTYANLLKPTEAVQEKANRLFDGTATEEQASGLQALESAASLNDVKLDESGLDLKDLSARIAAGEKIDTSQMSPENKKLVEMAQGMKGLTGLTKEQLGSLETMAKADTRDDKDAAKRLGVSEEDYKKMVRGEKDIDPNLRMFDSTEELKAARDENNKFYADKRKLARAEATLKATPQSKDAQTQVELSRAAVKAGEEKKAERMKALGLDISKEEDVATYNTRLDNQGQVELLEKRRAEYTSQRESMRASGMSEEQIDEKLGTMRQLEDRVQQEAKEARDKDTGNESINKLADDLGLTTAEDRQKFRSKVDLGGEGNERNLQMVSNVLDQVGKIDEAAKDEEGNLLFEKGMSKGDRLNQITDEYATAKTAEDKKALAKKYGLGEEQLERMMKQTEFLDLAGENKFDSKRLEEGLKSVSGRNVEEEVKKEEERTMRLTGTIEVRGDITGTANVGELSGVYPSR